ncbi:hypothetical protein [Nocardia neocaledoniensis]|uniref:hypothetical protein n=1 Tax=Nocardia neocaledoniensis TaxID=236511 RepID=UPI0024565DB1|nr:hypothetical protein [Nocardia neocaledoniensis]
MGDSADYEIFVRPDAVERALLILADHAHLPACAPTTVRLPGRRRVTLPFATGRAGRTIADCSLGADLDLMLSLRVAADEQIVDRYNLFARSLFADIDGDYYRYREDLTGDEMVDLLELTADERLARGAYVTSGTARVLVRLHVRFADELDPTYARIRVYTWSRSELFLFTGSPAFHRLFADLARATDAVCWLYGRGYDDAKTVHWLNGEPVDRIPVPGHGFANLAELVDSWRPVTPG